MTKMRKRITKHARQRLLERTGVSSSYARLLKNVSSKGYLARHYTGSFYSYLSSKNNGQGIKVYKEKIYVFSLKNKRLLTTYPVPAAYLPTSKYLIRKKYYNLVRYLTKNTDVNIALTLIDGQVLHGKVLFNDKYQMDRFDFKLNNDIVIKVYASDIAKYEFEDELIDNLQGEV